MDFEDPRGARAASDDVGLCLSGGGYRAMLFHLGALWRINDLGYLPRIDRISSVSGGSVTAGVLGAHWNRLEFDKQGVAQCFVQEIVQPLMALAGRTLDLPAILGGLLVPGRGSSNGHVVRSYKKHLFGDATLQSLPDKPRFVFNATNIQTGSVFRFAKPYLADWKVGRIFEPTTSLASVVAASSAFPPFLSPAVFHFDPSQWLHESGVKLAYPPYTTRVCLTDGGVYDNLGLEPVMKRCSTVLVSDGGGQFGFDPDPSRDWFWALERVREITDFQVRSRRRLALIESFRLPPNQSGSRMGAYWGLATVIDNYQLPDCLDCPAELTGKLASVPTRLGRMPDTVRRRLVNWGYAVADAALRRYLLHASRPSAPNDFPFPEAGVG